MSKIWCFIILLTLSGFCVQAQCSQQYTPIKTGKLHKEELKLFIKQNYAVNIKKIPASSYKEKVKEAYEEQFKYMTALVDSGAYYYDDTLYVYFQNILKTIQKSNPELDKPEIKLYLSRFTYPNAFCVGEGSIVFNIGLLRYLENESQIAFVLCHELAHYKQNHVFGHMDEVYTKLYSKEYQEKLKQIQSQEYYVNKKATELLKGLTFDTRKHSRYKESEADSLGLIYLMNTPYDVHVVPAFMAILDSIDHEKYRDSIQLTQFFSFESYPFKKSWIVEENPFMLVKDTVSEAEKDSLKTHPDCMQRKAAIETLLKTKAAPAKAKFVQSQALFNQLVYKSDFECVENRFNFENIDGSMYLILKLLKKYPDNNYLSVMLGKCLNTICKGLKEHRLMSYISLPSTLDEGDYKVLNKFLNTISMSEANKIYLSYMQQHIKFCQANEDYLYYAWLSASAAQNENLKKEWAGIYKSKFPNGKYIKLIN